MSHLFQPFSLGTNETIEDAFIAPPDNIQESRDAMEEVERRLLYDDFQKCGILPESILTLSDLLTRLRTSNRQYDEEMLRRIYAALSSFKGYREPHITGRVFLEAYMKRRRELLAVLESARAELDSAEMMLQQAESHLAALALDPNAAATEDSKLTVQVVALQNLDVGTPAAAEGDLFKVHLDCEQQVIETSVVSMTNGHCHFNEVFSFELPPWGAPGGPPGAPEVEFGESSSGVHGGGVGGRLCSCFIGSSRSEEKRIH